MPPRKNFPLRISPDLYAALERWAADDLRSVNAQIEYLLTQSVRQAGRLKDLKERPPPALQVSPPPEETS